MKKVATVLIASVLMMSLCGCKVESKKTNTSKETKESEVTTTSDDHTDFTSTKEISESVTSASEEKESETSIESKLKNEKAEIIRSKCQAWGLEVTEYVYDDSISLDTINNPSLTICYICYEDAKDAEQTFLCAIEESEEYGEIDETIVIMDENPQRVIRHGHRQDMLTDSVQNDIYLTVLDGRDYYFFYGRGDDSIYKVEELAGLLSIPLN